MECEINENENENLVTHTMVMTHIKASWTNCIIPLLNKTFNTIIHCAFNGNLYSYSYSFIQHSKYPQVDTELVIIITMCTVQNESWRQIQIKIIIIITTTIIITMVTTIMIIIQ